ncbi:MAG: PqqD family protein [Clostridiales bacterium]|nr:PqqD family protein [Clostridiales bacterium]
MKVKDGFILREVAGNFIVVAVGGAVKNFNAVITLNETGVLLWRALEKGATQDELVKVILDEYDIDETTAKADVLAFINKLQGASLLV